MPHRAEPPHLRRVLDLLRRLPGPRIQVWAWPGGGAAALLASLLEEEGRNAQRLSREAASAARAPGAARWLVWEESDGPPLEVSEAVMRPADRRLVFVGRVRDPETQAVLVPADLLLTEAEVGKLLERHTAGEVSAELVRRLAQATDGWLRPLELALAAGAGVGRPEPTPEGLLSVPAVHTFLRHEVFEPLPAPLRALALELAMGEDLDLGFWGEIWEADDPRTRLLADLTERHGLAVGEVGGRRRLPRLLATFLRRERQRLWPSARSFALAQRLALASYSLGRPRAALGTLTEAGDPLRTAAILDLEWPELLAGAAPELLRSALRLAPPAPGAGGEILALAVEAVSGDRRRAAIGLAELAARPGGSPTIDAAARLLVAMVRGSRGAPEVATEVERVLAGAGALAPGLRPLLAAVARPEPPTGPVAAGLGTSVADLLLGLTGRGAAAPPAPPAPRRTGRPGRGRDPAPPSFQVVLFGLPRVLRLDGMGPSELAWPLRRALRTFAYLASSPGHRATREELVEAVWGEEDTATVRRNFHPTLSHLRRTLAERRSGQASPLLFRDGVYRLNPAIQWRIDAAEFDTLAERGQIRAEEADLAGAIELWLAAWRLYTGPLLEGFYERWAEERREACLHRHHEMLRRLGDALVESGDPGRALDAYRALLAIDPLQERVHLAVMRLYARQSRRDLVRKQYDRLAGLLREELGVEALPETTAEYHRLMG